MVRYDNCNLAIHPQAAFGLVPIVRRGQYSHSHLSLDSRLRTLPEHRSSFLPYLTTSPPAVCPSPPFPWPGRALQLHLITIAILLQLRASLLQQQTLTSPHLTSSVYCRPQGRSDASAAAPPSLWSSSTPGRPPSVGRLVLVNPSGRLLHSPLNLSFIQRACSLSSTSFTSHIHSSIHSCFISLLLHSPHFALKFVP